MNSVEKQALVAMIFEKHKETDLYCKMRAEKAERVQSEVKQTVQAVSNQQFQYYDAVD